MIIHRTLPWLATVAIIDSFCRVPPTARVELLQRLNAFVIDRDQCKVTQNNAKISSYLGRIYTPPCSTWHCLSAMAGHLTTMGLTTLIFTA